MTTDNNFAPKPAQSVDDIIAAPRNARLVHTYMLPASLLEYVPESVVGLGFVELTPEEELMATKRARGDAVRLAYELALESLKVAIKPGPATPDGAPTYRRVALSTADGTADVFWGKLHPKVRTLCITAYGELHQPKEDELKSFLGSRKTSVG